MHNPYRGGTADVWYSGKRDAWIEYKWINSLPKKGVLVPDLSGLQKHWLGSRFIEGRNVFVVVGCPSGAVVFSNPAEWNDGLTPVVLSKPDYVVWLTKTITGDVDAGNKNTKKRGNKRDKSVQGDSDGNSAV